MRRPTLVAAVLAALTAGAFAQTGTGTTLPAPAGPGGPPPVTAPDGTTSEQVAVLLRERGFNEITRLTRDNDGIWRGEAMKDGQRVQVIVSRDGSISHQ